MNESISDDERLANYLLEASKFKTDGVDHRAFLPGPDGERSLFRVDGLCEEFIAATGQAFVGNLRDKKIKGWALLRAGVASRCHPLILRADIPPPRHAVVVGWPAALEERRKLALLLASKAEPYRWPPLD